MELPTLSRIWGIGPRPGRKFISNPKRPFWGWATLSGKRGVGSRKARRLPAKWGARRPFPRRLPRIRARRDVRPATGAGMGDAGEKGLRGRAVIAARSSLRFRTRGPARPLSGPGRSLGGARPLGRVTVGGAQGACQVRQPVARPAPWKGDCIGPRDARRRAAARACRALGGHFSSVSIHISTGPVVHARMQHTVPPTLTRSSATRRRWVGEPPAPAFSRRDLGSGPGVVVPYRSFRFAKAMVGGYPSFRPARMRPSQPEIRPCSIGC